MATRKAPKATSKINSRITVDPTSGMTGIRIGRSPSGVEWWCWVEGKSIAQVAADTKTMTVALNSLIREDLKAKKKEAAGLKRRLFPGTRTKLTRSGH